MLNMLTHKDFSVLFHANVFLFSFLFVLLFLFCLFIYFLCVAGFTELQERLDGEA